MNESAHPYESLTPDAVLAAVEAEGFLCDGRILPLNSYENRVYQLGIEEGSPIIAKFYRPERWSDEQIIEEHRFCLELAEHELPVVPPLKNKQGETLRNQQGFRLALFERRGGHAPELDRLDHLEVLGRFMGRLHSIGDLTLFKHRPTIDVQSYGEQSAEFLLQHDFIPDDLKPAYETLSQDLLKQLRQRFEQCHFDPLRLHGDCHPGNMLWRDDAPNFVDFDDSRNGPAVQDIWMLLSGDLPQQQQQLDKVLSGYRQFFSFNPAELSLIEPLRTLRIMHYAAWLARRWSDPAFPHNFPWFNSQRYWSEHILTLREQLAALQEPPLQMPMSY